MSTFLEDANICTQAIRNGGLLCITCTDLAVLCGNNPEVCFARYRAVPGKAQYVHENAIRIGT